MSVVGFHAGVPYLSGGFIGVDVFFVISGYLITQLITREVEAGTFSLWNFYERRVRRIIPALFAMIALCILVGFIARLSPSTFRQFSGSVGAATLFSSNFWFWHQTGYFAATEDTIPLLHTWSLAVEEQYYILYPLLLLTLLAFRKRHLVVAIAALFTISLALAVWTAHFDFPTAVYLLPFRAWELLLGSLLALYPALAPRNRTIAYLAGALGLALIVYSVFAFTSDSPYRSLIMPCCGAALLLYANAGPATLVGSAMASLPMRFTGRISYSLYLWHWPFLVFGPLFFPPFWRGPYLSLTLVAAAFVAAMLSYWFVEQPLRSPNGFLTRKSLFVAAAVIAALFVGIGSIGYFSGGLPSRFNQQDRTLFSYDDYWNRSSFAAETRQGICFIEEGEKYRQDLCFSAPPNTHTLLMWGDSHSADLIKSVDSLLLPSDTRVLQATMGGCHPILQLPRAKTLDDSCATFNAKTFALIGEHHPDTVVLSARWEGKEHYLPALHGTIEKLVSLGTRVIVIGPVMAYKESLPDILVRYRHSPFPLESVQRNELFDEDASLASLVAGTKGATYVSALKALCPNRICRVWARDSIPMTFDDEGHLTYEGSQVVVREALAKQLTTGK